jgi:beta-N-acetylhexosaminidase
MKHRVAIIMISGAILCAMSACAPGSKEPSAQTQAPVTVTHDEALKWADTTLAGLTLERKIGQMITTDITGGYIADNDPRLAQWIRLARELGVGGFVNYGGTPRDVAHLLNRLQKEAELPILMSSDFEGGPGQQVTGASEFPGDQALSAAGSEDLTYKVAKIGATEGRAMGFHLTYSPVADVSVNPDNPAESVRTFGGDLDLMGRMIKAYIRGYQENGMLTTAKHFPGRGDSKPMPAYPGFSFLDKPAADVESQEFAAFKNAIDGGVTFVMTEHIAVPSVTGGSELPASVEGKLATGWLRDKLGFKGILTTDDLWYDNVVNRFGREDVAVKALLAGHDIMLKPKDPFATAKRVVEAVNAGEIPLAKIDASVRKILYWKARLGLHKNRFIDESLVGSLVGTPEHLAVVQEVADKSMTLLKNDNVLPVAASRLGKMVNINIQKADADPSPAALSGKLAAAFPGTQSFTLRPDLDAAAYEKALQAAKGADLVILSLFVPRNRQGDPAPLRDADLALIGKIIKAKPGAVIAMSYGNPYLIKKLDSVPAFMVGYGEKGWFGNQPVYFESFIKVLKGELDPQGKLPVKVNDAYTIGAGL